MCRLCYLLIAGSLRYPGFMARKALVHLSRALFDVISQGNQRQRLCKDDEDYRRFEALLDDGFRRHSLTLSAYVLMPNYFDPLLEVSRAPLSTAMQRLLSACRPLQSALPQDRPSASRAVLSDFVRSRRLSVSVNVWNVSAPGLGKGGAVYIKQARRSETGSNLAFRFRRMALIKKQLSLFVRQRFELH